jgi:hypothetical protein
MAQNKPIYLDDLPCKSILTLLQTQAACSREVSRLNPPEYPDTWFLRPEHKQLLSACERIVSTQEAPSP